MDTLECEQYLVTQGITRDLKKDYWDWIRWENKKGLGDWKLTLRETEARWKFIQKYGFAILHEPAIEAMRPYAPLLEIGAGSGYWSHELQQHGIDVIATDSETGTYGFWGKDGDSTGRWKNFYTDIQTLDCRDAVRKYPQIYVPMPHFWGNYDRNLVIASRPKLL